MKLQAGGLQLYLIKTLAQVFSCEFCEISNITFYTKHLQVAGSIIRINIAISESFLNLADNACYVLHVCLS